MKRLLLLSLAVLLTGNVALGAYPTSAASIGDITTDNSNTANAISDGLFYNYSGGSVSQNFEASQPIPYLPGTPGVAATAPTLFSLQGFPAQIKGLSLLTKNLIYASYHDVAMGASKGTKIIFNGSFPAPKPPKAERSVYVSLDGVARGEVVGSLTIQSRKEKGDEVDFSTLVYDARQYIAKLQKLDGYDVTLLTIPNTVSYALGVNGKSSGVTVAPLVSGLINGPLGAMAGLASGFSSNGGITTPTGLIGCTFLVLVHSDKSQYVNLTPNGIVPEENESHGNGNNRKKYEATQE